MSGEPNSEVLSFLQESILNLQDKPLCGYKLIYAEGVIVYMALFEVLLMNKNHDRGNM